MHRIFIATFVVSGILSTSISAAFAVTKCPKGMRAYATVRGDTCPKLNRKLNYPDVIDIHKLNKPISNFHCPLNRDGGQTICYPDKGKSASIMRNDPNLLAFAPFFQNVTKL